MTTKEQLISEIDAVPEQLLTEVLDFIHFLKEKDIRRVDEVTVTSESSLSKDWLTPQEDEAWRSL